MNNLSRALRILIVDDSPEDRYTYRRLLTAQSRREIVFIESEVGEEGLEACIHEKPDCVLLDYRLPDLTGVEFLSHLRSVESMEVIPVIVLTRQGNEEIAVQAMKNGAQDYLLKDTLTAEILCRAVDNAIEKISLTTAKQKAERELRQALDQLERKVEERTRELTRANRIKDEFLATLSHELRTPLTAILGWTTIMREGKLTSERRDAALEIVDRNARVQAKLIEDLLDVSRIITGKFHISFAQVELNKIVRAAVEVIRPAAEAKQLQVTLDLDAEPIIVGGDEARLQQAVWNLLSNAVKFAKDGGSVIVTLERTDDRVRVSVTDDGFGIAPEFLPFVFDRFRQADGSSTRVHGGLGLGLAIVRHIVELHGGAVCASSDGEQRGATFAIELPVFTSSDRKAVRT